MYSRLLCILFCVFSLVSALNAKNRLPNILYSMDGISNRERFQYAIDFLKKELPASGQPDNLKIAISTMGQKPSLADSIKRKLTSKEHFVFYREPTIRTLQQ